MIKIKPKDTFETSHYYVLLLLERMRYSRSRIRNFYSKQANQNTFCEAITIFLEQILNVYVIN